MQWVLELVSCAPGTAVMQSHRSSFRPRRRRTQVSDDEDRAEQTDRWAKPSVVRVRRRLWGHGGVVASGKGVELVLEGEECLVDSWGVRGRPPGRASYEQLTDRKMLHPVRVHTG